MHADVSVKDQRLTPHLFVFLYILSCRLYDLISYEVKLRPH